MTDIYIYTTNLRLIYDDRLQTGCTASEQSASEQQSTYRVKKEEPALCEVQDHDGQRLLPYPQAHLKPKLRLAAPKTRS